MVKNTVTILEVIILQKRWRLVAGIILGLMLIFLVTLFAFRPWHLRWGATDAEVNRRLPGDELVANPKWGATHAITIRASAEEVWSWLVQMGQGRGGFYSYDWLENLFGLDIHNADRIIQEFQHLKVGDTVRLFPGGGPTVAVLEPGRALVLFGLIDPATGCSFKPTDKLPDNYFATGWGFYLDPIDARTTRLIERFQIDWNPPSFLNTLGNRVILEPASFVMERKMLLGIKQRAEERTT